MKIEKNHASILLLIGFMIIVLLRTMKCYSLNKQLNNMQTINNTEQNIYEGFKIETYTDDIVGVRFERFKYSLNKTLCIDQKADEQLTKEQILNKKKDKIRKMAKHFRSIVPNKGKVSDGTFITEGKKVEGEALLKEIESLLETTEANRNQYCTNWKNGTTSETFVADFNSTGIVNNTRPEIVTDTLNNLNKIQVSNNGQVFKIGDTFKDNESFIQNLPDVVGKPAVSSGPIKTNILCPGINIATNLSINNLMDEFYYLKDHVKDLILANQSYEKAFVK